jgi:pimeloyl-ACP methyl ester carboxylesterase
VRRESILRIAGGVLGFALLVSSASGGEDPFGTPHPAAAPEQAQLDFIIGEWRLATWFARPDGSRREGTATMRARYVLDGRGIEIVSRYPGTNGEPDYLSTRTLVYNTELSKWVGSGINTLGNRKDYEGSLVDGNLVVIQSGMLFQGRPGINRTTYHDISENSFRLRFDHSGDEGRTWQEGTFGYTATRVRLVHEADCGFSVDGVELDCGFIEVAENRDLDGRGRYIPYFFVRARATGPDRATDPLVELVGGPGQHASDFARDIVQRDLPRLGRRDLLIVDQRGTGRSNRLDCFSHDLAADPDALRKLFDQDFFDPGAFRRCLAELETRADLTRYTTTASAHDLEELRVALGYDVLNLRGGSYGTRLGLEYIRRYPESVRSAVLAGVAPGSALLVETVARDFQDALDAVIEACEAEEACAAAYPGFRAELHALLEEVDGQAVTVALPHPATGDPHEVRLRHAQLITALRYTLYSVRLSAGLPKQVRAAADGDWTPLAGMLPALLVGLHNAVAEGMWASVKCAEELPFIDPERARKLSSGTLMGTLRLDDEMAICSFWPRGEAAPDFHEPVRADVPVLLIAGEFDPASPLGLAEEAAKHLGRGVVVRVRNRSHWGLGGDACVDGLVEAFLEAGHGDDLDVGCATEYERPPFQLP